MLERMKGLSQGKLLMLDKFLNINSSEECTNIIDKIEIAEVVTLIRHFIIFSERHVGTS